MSSASLWFLIHGCATPKQNHAASREQGSTFSYQLQGKHREDISSPAPAWSLSPRQQQSPTCRCAPMLPLLPGSIHPCFAVVFKAWTRRANYAIEQKEMAFWNLVLTNEEKKKSSKMPCDASSRALHLADKICLESLLLVFAAQG